MAGSEVVTLYVAGLSCPFCSYGVEKKLSELEGVESVAVHLEQGAVTVRVADGVTLADAAFRRAVEEAGFSLRELKRGTRQDAGQGPRKP